MSRLPTVTRSTLTLLSLALLAGGCASSGSGNSTVTRVDPKTSPPIDYNYRFDDDDARQISQELIADCLRRPWIDSWMAEHAGKRPMIFVGTVRNETQDYIDTKSVTKRFEEELLNSGRVRVKAEREFRAEIRAEREEEQRWVAPDQVKKMAAEAGGDLILLGRVADNRDERADRRAMTHTYQFTVELINLETNEKVYIRTQEVKKNVTR